MFSLRCAYCFVFFFLLYDLTLEKFRFFLYSLSICNSRILIKWFDMRSIQNWIRFWVNILFQQWSHAMFIIFLILKTFTEISQLICDLNRKFIFFRYSTFYSSSTWFNHVQIRRIVASKKSQYVCVHENRILMFRYMCKRFVLHDYCIWFSFHTFLREK